MIHCTHSTHGFDLGVLDFNNYVLFSESVTYYNNLNSDKMIIHTGIMGHIDTAIAGIKSLKNIYNHVNILIENEPIKTLTGDTCLGVTALEVKRITEQCGVGFVFDIPHTMSYYTSFNMVKDIDFYKFLGYYKLVNIDMIHLSDIKLNSLYDEHLHIGDGDLDFKKIFEMFNCDITIECMKKDLDEFKDDVIKLIHIQRSIK